MKVNNGVIYDLDKMDEVKSWLDSLRKDHFYDGAEGFSDRRYCEFTADRIRGLNLDHDNFLDSVRILERIEEKYKEYASRVSGLESKLDKTYRIVKAWETSSGKETENLTKITPDEGRYAITEGYSPNIIVEYKNKDGKVVSQFLHEYREYLEKITGANVSSEGVTSQTNNSTSTNSTPSTNSGSVISGAGVVTTPIVNNTIQNNKPNNNTNNIVNNNQNSQQQVTPNQNQNTNNNSNNQNKVPNNNTANNNTEKDKEEKPINKEENKNENKTPIENNNKPSDTKVPDTSTNNNSNQGGFGQIFNKDNSSNTKPNISTNVIQPNKQDTPNIDTSNPSNTGDLPLNNESQTENIYGDFGNVFENDNVTSPSPIVDENKSKGFNPIPLGVGLGLATAAGIGAKVIHDRKKNNELDEEQLEAFEGNKFWLDDEPSVINSEEDSFANEDFNRFDSGIDSAGYSASYSTNITDSAIPDNTWSIEDDAQDNDQMVDLLNGN